MQNELSDSDVVRLIAYVSPYQAPEFEDDDDEEMEEDTTVADEYLIDFLTVQEAKSIGNDGLLSKIADALFTKNVIGKSEKDQAKVVWRLLPIGGLTPIELQTKEINDEVGFEQESYKVKDLRHLH